MVSRVGGNLASGLMLLLNESFKVGEILDAEGIEIPFPQLDVHHHGTPEKNA